MNDLAACSGEIGLSYLILGFVVLLVVQVLAFTRSQK